MGTRLRWLAASIAAVTAIADAAPVSARELVPTRPLPGLTSAERARFQAGKDEFERLWRAEEGLGPTFNEASCAQCHRQPDIGGAGYPANVNFLYGMVRDGVFHAPAGGPVLRQSALPGVTLEQVPSTSNVVSLRKTPAIFGLGLVEAIPDRDLVRLARVNGGRVARNARGRLMRFGSQNQAAGLREFIATALDHELGIGADEASEEVIDRLRDFVALSAPLPRGRIGVKEQLGAALFEEIGCASCHVPTLTTRRFAFTTADGVRVNIAALRNRDLHPYSDFLLHDLGPALDDGLPLGEAASGEYRTTPLWGLRFRKPGLLHDGRVQTLDLAILLHAGEAAISRANFLALQSREREFLLEFLRSL